MHYVVRFLVARRWRALALMLALLVVAGLGLPRIRFDNTPDAFFMQGDKALRAFQQFRADFGSDEYSFVVLEAPLVWSPEFVTTVRGLTRAIAATPDVTRVTSITNVRHVAGSAGALSVGEFIEAAPSAESLAARRALALAHPYYRDFLVSADGRHLGILAETVVRNGEVAYKITLTDRLRALLAEPQYAVLKPRIVGAPVIDRDVFFLINQESLIFGTLSFALVAVGFYAMFRSWLAALLPLGVASLSIVVAFGYMGWTGAALGMLTPIVPSFLISVGVGSSVFLLSEVFQRSTLGQPLAQALDGAIGHTATNGAISVATTALALFSFASSDVKPAQDVGLAAGVGLLTSYVFAMLLVPMVLGRRPTLSVAPRAAAVLTGRVQAMEWLGGWVAGHWKLLLLLLAGLLCVAGVGLTKLRTDYHYVGLFKPSTDIRQSYEHVDRTLRGGAGFEVVFDIGALGTDASRQPEVLQAVRDFQTRLEQRFPALGLKTYSLADVVMEVNQAVHEGAAAHYRLPDNRRGVAEALLLFESSGDGEIDRLLSADGHKLRVNVRAKYRPDSEYQPVFVDIRRYIEQERPAVLQGAQVEVTGVVALWSRITGYLAQTEIQSMTLSALVVLGAMVLVFRSLPLALVMALCNLVPVAFVLAFMGWMDIFLDPFTILIATIAIGVLDDDTIHFVHRVLHNHRQGRTMPAALGEAFGSTGLAMLILSAVLVAGFLVYTLSHVASLSKFGAITALALGLGALCELFFTPAVLMACDRVGLLRRAPRLAAASAAGG